MELFNRQWLPLVGPGGTNSLTRTNMMGTIDHRHLGGTCFGSINTFFHFDLTLLFEIYRGTLSQLPQSNYHRMKHPNPIPLVPLTLTFVTGEADSRSNHFPDTSN